MYPYLLETCFERGILRSSSGHVKVTVEMLAEWTGFSEWAIYSWLRERTSASHRPMPRSAIRLVIHEFKARDQSNYRWDRLLRLCE